MNNYNTDPVSQTVQLFVAQNAVNTTLLSSTARTTGSDAFPTPPTPVPGPKTYSSGAFIGICCAAGVLLLALIVVLVLCNKSTKRNEAEEIVYRVNNSESAQTALI